MIPEGLTVTTTGKELYPSKTYRMKIDGERIQGAIQDEREAIEQAIYKILNTERYKHIIYSWNYGVELADLIGAPMPFVLPEIPRRIREALIMDDRIDEVDGFELKYDKKGNVLARFTAHTRAGAISVKKEVTVRNA